MQSRQDFLTLKIAVAAGFVTQQKADECARLQEENANNQVGLNVAHLLLKKGYITPMQFRLLNTAVRYESLRDEDILLGRFLIKNKYLTEEKAKEALAEQDPYYREGKEFPRLEKLLVEGNYLTQDRMTIVKKMMGGLGKALQQAAGSRMPSVAMADGSGRDLRKSTIRQEALLMDHCRVNVRKELIKSLAGEERKIYVLSVSGQLDAHSFAEFDAFLSNLIERNRYRLVVNMEKLSYISSAGIGALVGAVKKARDLGGDVKLCKIPEDVMKIIALVGFEKLMEILPNEPDSVLAFR